jgi:hypothetical protein
MTGRRSVSDTLQPGTRSSVASSARGHSESPTIPSRTLLDRPCEATDPLRPA